MADLRKTDQFFTVLRLVELLFVVWGFGWVWVGLGQLFGGLGWVWVDDMDPRTTLVYYIRDLTFTTEQATGRLK